MYATISGMDGVRTQPIMWFLTSGRAKVPPDRQFKPKYATCGAGFNQIARMKGEALLQC